MSAPHDHVPRHTPGPASRGGCLSASLVLLGIALLLPGICSLIFMIPFLVEGESAGGFAIVWLITFGIAAFGIWLIRDAWRDR